MTANEVMRSSDRETIKFIRLACIGGAIIYPAWSLIYAFITDGKADDPLGERMVLVGVVGLIFASTFVNRWRKYYLILTYVGVYLGHAHLFWLVYRNDVSPPYQMGMICLIAALAPYFNSIKGLGAYFAFNVLCISLGLLS